MFPTNHHGGCPSPAPPAPRSVSRHLRRGYLRRIAHHRRRGRLSRIDHHPRRGCRCRALPPRGTRPTSRRALSPRSWGHRETPGRLRPCGSLPRGKQSLCLRTRNGTGCGRGGARACHGEGCLPLHHACRYPQSWLLGGCREGRCRGNRRGFILGWRQSRSPPSAPKATTTPGTCSRAPEGARAPRCFPPQVTPSPRGRAPGELPAQNSGRVGVKSSGRVGGAGRLG